MAGNSRRNDDLAIVGAGIVGLAQAVADDLYSSARAEDLSEPIISLFAN